MMRYAKREVGAGLLVIGVAGVLEYAEVFGDGGSAFQLIAGIVFAIVGFVILVRNAVGRSD
ncbi:MAG TPA: hypothetical protein VEV43_08180 [Actinomycetota bacterium]|nr:hypothetical protein [Actinomycetota bacterium]